MIHEENEAENEGYIGLHQWNLCAENMDMTIWNREFRTSLGEEFGDRIRVVKCDKGKGDQAFRDLTMCQDIAREDKHRHGDKGKAVDAREHLLRHDHQRHPVELQRGHGG